MAEFDSHADSYHDEIADSISFCGSEHEYFTRRKADELDDLSRRLLGDPSTLSALDVGCGIGLTDEQLAGRFGELHGVDLSADAVARAAERNPDVGYRTYDGDKLPYDANSFDVAFAICVAHHVAPGRRDAFAAEIARVVRPGGLVAVFEHNPFNPLTRVAVSRCEFDEGVVLLSRRASRRMLVDAGLQPVEARYVIFTTIDRPWMERAERMLRGVPLGAQHYVVARRPR